MNPRKDSSPWYREPLVWLLILIPASAVVMGVVIVTLAVSTYDGLVEDDYYKRGLEINKSLARDQVAAWAGLRARLVFDQSAGRIGLVLTGNESFVAPAHVRLAMFHATRSGLDKHLLLERIGSSEYSGEYLPLEPGGWQVQLEAGDWRLTGEHRAPGPTELSLSHRRDV